MEPDQHQLTPRRVFIGVIVVTGTFAVLGTVAAIWENPFFVRMTPAGNAEIWILGLLAVLIGVFVAIRRPACSTKTAGVGGVLGFIGVACPVCNKILLVIFGGDLLLTYFEPIRIYVAVIGVAIAGWAVIREIQRKDVACRELQDTPLTPTAGS